MNQIPNFLNNMLLEQYGENNTNQIIQGYRASRKSSFRVNTLKANREEIASVLQKNHIPYEQVSTFQDAFAFEKQYEQQIRNLEIYEQGKVYFQSLSSMLPVLILEPKEKEDILDMAAAPGGKTSQISAITNGKAYITACEKNPIRAERLRYNMQKLGIPSVNILVKDARKLDDAFSFDKILLDAPCSGSGTLRLEENAKKKDEINLVEEEHKINIEHKENKKNRNTKKSTEANFSEELIRRSVKIQNELLEKAIRLLKPEHELVYSTCSILKQENEKQIEKILQKGKVEIVPISKELLTNIPLLPVTLEGTVCVKPSEYYEGFFVVKLKKYA